MSPQHSPTPGPERPLFTTRQSPPIWLRTVGAAVIVVVLGATLLVLTDTHRPPLIVLLLLAVLLILVICVGISLMISPVRATITAESVTARYGPFHHTVAVSDLEEILEGDQIRGLGYGFGVRWEGKGRWAYRIGGPMVTLVHRRGRLAISVPDPTAFRRELDLVRRTTDHA